MIGILTYFNFNCINTYFIIKMNYNINDQFKYLNLKIFKVVVHSYNCISISIRNIKKKKINNTS